MPKTLTLPAPSYPEHIKLRAIQSQSQVIADFLAEWCPQNGYALCEMRGDDWCLPFTPIETILAKYFDIDLKKLEAEKRTMLDEQRALNAKGNS